MWLGPEEKNSKSFTKLCKRRNILSILFNNKRAWEPEVPCIEFIIKYIV